MGARIEIKGLTRRFAGAQRPALDDLSLVVEPGETLCLVGPSGCGKSTALRLIAGLDQPDAGAVRIDGADMSGVAPQARDVAMVFQGFALYPHMRVRQILEFPLKMRGVARSEREQAVQRAAEMLGLGELLERRPGELSGGERQRVAMGRAIVRNPKVFLFDEPLSNLDAALRAELRVELGRLLRRLAATAIYVTHDQAEAMTLGHRIALLRTGRLEQVDSPRRIYEEPATVFSASFFGAPPMNLLPAERDGSHVRVADWSLDPPAGAPARLIAGVRPEHVLLSRGGAATGHVVAVEPLGAETHVDVESGGALLRVRVEGFDAPAMGEAVAISPRPGKLRWFDADTGRAL